MKKKTLFSMVFCLTVTGFVSFSAHADDAASTLNNKVDEATAPAKSRKKKAQMCKECGRPEAQCECKGHGEDHADHAGKKR